MWLDFLLFVWGAITVVWIVLLIYRGTVSMHEDDQLFLEHNDTESQKEQTEVLRRLQSLQWPVRLLGGASGLLILVIFGLWLWRGLNRI